MTESSDETRPHENEPAAVAGASPSAHEPTVSSEPLVSEPETTTSPVGAPEGDAASEEEASAGAPGELKEPEAEPLPEPEPEREPVVVTAEDLQAAVESVRTAIRAGESVVFPTDTVYGIAADPFSPQAVQGLLDAKHRGRDMPPPVLIGDAEVLEAYTRDVPAAARLLANRYWPGPLTLILTAQSSLRMDLGETQGSIGVRVPDHEVTRAILRATGPLAVSSANISGEPAATDATEARRQLRGSVAVYVDGGPTPGPTPSTIVDFASTLAGRVLRVGAIPLDELRKLLPGLEGPEPEAPAEEPAEASEPAVTDAAAGQPEDEHHETEHLEASAAAAEPEATAAEPKPAEAAATTVDSGSTPTPAHAEPTRHEETSG
ncbi:MAG TPA: L-threonylcarbamoyladenylate synthase [Propionibacteriaceae bacterium]|nr:L-threonylcarbamoyladenylate synthase [Propionibacteriaceae bacterium]